MWWKMALCTLTLTKCLHVVGVHLHCVVAFVWLCTMRCIVHLAVLRLLLRDWLCCCAAVLRSCTQHLAALPTLLTDADAQFTD